nr:lycopene cyclase domain-containing protein [Mucilaginibacter roseus]
MLILSAVLLILHYDRLYTAVTFGLLFVVIVYLQFIARAEWLSRFYMAYIVSLLPFYIVNGLLTSIPVVLYNDAENLGFRVGTIPFEDHFYSLALLVMNVGFFEYFKNRNANG